MMNIKGKKPNKPEEHYPRERVGPSASWALFLLPHIGQQTYCPYLLHWTCKFFMESLFEISVKYLVLFQYMLVN